ncbi:MAG: DUF1704 domain-containing protein [Candidatus Saccharibacteria bacterium]|nr:DUF1704 domain-containing protein [Candidatus Saccharibacteria bacterium]
MHREKTLNIEQLISPKHLPEAGFQSYEQFTSNAIDKREGFIADEYRNPTLHYGHFLDLLAMDQGILTLHKSIEQAEQYEDNPDFQKAIRSSLEFRAAEMEFVKLLARLDFLCKEGGQQEEIAEVADMARQLNHELYGRPDPEIRDAALNELWSMLDQKQYSSSAQGIYDELVNGYSWRGESMPGLMRAENPDARLPRFENNEALEWAGEQIIEQNADIQALVDAFWEQKVTDCGEDYACHPEDIVEAFQQVIDMRDPGHESGVTVRLVEGKTALSWESPEMAVLVGSRRAPITNKDELFRKVLHEFGVHGQRSINGLKTDLPVLGTGLFTDTERPDYLTFEEGLATTVEEMIGDTVPEWTALKLGHYINISLAEQGADFRTVFETAWRYRLLSKLDDSAEVTESMIDKAKRTAYNACVRIFRGTQPDMAEQTGVGTPPLTYNKDLAYLEGRVLAMRHLSGLYHQKDTDGIARLFAGKYDPTNVAQDNIVRQAVQG